MSVQGVTQRYSIEFLMPVKKILHRPHLSLMPGLMPHIIIGEQHYSNAKGYHGQMFKSNIAGYYFAIKMKKFTYHPKAVRHYPYGYGQVMAQFRN